VGRPLEHTINPGSHGNVTSIPDDALAALEEDSLDTLHGAPRVSEVGCLDGVSTDGEEQGTSKLSSEDKNKVMGGVVSSSSRIVDVARP